MRLEDLLVRYLPEGGTILDMRSADAGGNLALSHAAGISVEPEADHPDLILLAPEQLTDDAPPAAWTVILAKGPALDAPLPDVLAWAGSGGGQLVEVTGLLSPRCVALIVARTDSALVPSQPGGPAGEGDASTWRRLAGELIAERFRNTLLQEQFDRAQDAAAAEKAKADDAKRRVRTLRRRLDEAQAQAGRGSVTGRVARLGRRQD